MVGHDYIVTNRMNGTLYTGVSSDLVKRAYQHRHGLIEWIPAFAGMTN